jgi:cytochrome b involved in lipid metabolism
MGKGGESAQQEKVRQISLEELSEHRTPEDAWMTYKGKVYDVSGWQDHPGILSHWKNGTYIKSLNQS